VIREDTLKRVDKDSEDDDSNSDDIENSKNFFKKKKGTKETEAEE
jgi:hypothetical protein